MKKTKEQSGIEYVEKEITLGELMDVKVNLLKMYDSIKADWQVKWDLLHQVIQPLNKVIKDHNEEVKKQAAPLGEGNDMTGYVLKEENLDKWAEIIKGLRGVKVTMKFAIIPLSLLMESYKTAIHPSEMEQIESYVK